MSIINSMFNKTIHLNRYADILYQGEVIESIVQIDPSESSRIEITLDTAQSGTVYLRGTMSLDSGLCDSGETVTFTATKGNMSSNYFTLLNGICPSVGMTGIMTVRAKTGDGSPVIKSFFETSFPGFYQVLDKSIKPETYGYDENSNAIMYCEGNVDIENGDRVTVGNDPISPSYEIISITDVEIDGNKDYKKIVLR